MSPDIQRDEDQKLTNDIEAELADWAASVDNPISPIEPLPNDQDVSTTVYAPTTEKAIPEPTPTPEPGESKELSPKEAWERAIGVTHSALSEFQEILRKKDAKDEELEKALIYTIATYRSVFLSHENLPDDERGNMQNIDFVFKLRNHFFDSIISSKSPNPVPNIEGQKLLKRGAEVKVDEALQLEDGDEKLVKLLAAMRQLFRVYAGFGLDNGDIYEEDRLKYKDKLYAEMGIK